MTYQEMFDAINWNKIPSMIAHEVLRSHEYFKQQQYFLVIFQIKDMYEVMIKTLALTAIASYEQRFREWHNVHRDEWFQKYMEICANPGDFKAKGKKRDQLFNQLCNIKRNTSSAANNSFPYQYTNEDIIEYCNYRYVLNYLLNNSLSLGDWVDHILTKTEKFSYIPSELKGILKSLLDSIKSDSANSFNLPSWRNNEIGHGALTVKANAEYITDIQKKLHIMLKVIFDNQDAFYTLNYHTEDKEIYLNGRDSAVNLPEGDFRIYADFSGTDVLCPIEPFIRITQKGIYLFDSFVPYRKHAYSIDYPNGIRNKSHDTLISWLNTLRSQFYSTGEYSFSSIYSAGIDNNVLDSLNNIPGVKDFVEPHYLSRRIESFLEENEKGLYLLYLERGMGKSYFAKGLNQNDDTKNVFEPEDTGWQFRTIHLNTYTFYEGKMLRHNLPNAILPPNIKTRTFDLKCRSEDSIQKKQELTAEYINTVKKEFYKDDAFILVIDGLDELPYHEDDLILDYIPSKDMLDEDVYIILTSRTSDGTEGTHSIFSKIKKWSNDRDMQIETILSNSPEYQEFAADYLKKKKIHITEAEIQKLMSNQETRKMVYLSLLAECYSHNRDLQISEDENIVFTYLKMLIHTTEHRSIDKVDTLSNTENKYMKIILDVLAVLTMYGEALNIYQLKFLINEYTNDYELLGILKDINGLLRIERTANRHRLFTIGHHYLREQAKIVLTPRIKKLTEIHTRHITDISVDNIKELLDAAFQGNTEKTDEEVKEIIDSVFGLYTLFANSKMYFELEDIGCNFSLFEKAYLLNDGIFKIYRFLTESPQLMLIRKKLYQLQDIYITADNTLKGSQFDRYKKIYSEYCMYLRDTNSPKNLAYAEELLQTLLNDLDERSLNTDEFYSDLQNRYGLTLRRLNKSQEALEAFEKSLTFYKTAENYDISMQLKKLANIGIDKRNLFFSFFKAVDKINEVPDATLLNDAITCSSEAIIKKEQIRQVYKEKGNLDSLAFTYHSRGLTKFYKAVFQHFYSKKQEHKECYYKDVFRTHIALDKISESAETTLIDSINDYKKTILIFDEAIQDNPNTKTSVLAFCYSHLGDNHWLLGEHSKALEAYEKAIKLYEEKMDFKNPTLYKMHAYTIINALKMIEKQESATLEMLSRKLTELFTAIQTHFTDFQLRESYNAALQEILSNQSVHL